ncbi:MAG: secondary thiamine-phosphate synthase enzyme YjbQ [Nitrospinales bacterium]
MQQRTHEFYARTRGQGLYSITGEIESWLRGQGMTTGILTVFIAHTSASLVIQENADPDVLEDLKGFFSRLAPEGDPVYRHTLEGADDMPAHIRSALTQTQLAIPLVKGRPALGVWQGIYVFEHRHASQNRKIVLHLLGE